MPHNVIDILLVEDNPAEANLTKEALKEWKTQTRVNVVNNGDEALKYLRKQEKYSGASRPDLIFLDLNLPKKSGREVLKEIKTDPELRTIPVLVLTVSEAETDVSTAYRLYANSYINKTLDFGQFIAMMKKIEEYWFSVVKLHRTN
jgi:two-component system, chemotaxis family, response regulator Rcp1